MLDIIPNIYIIQTIEREGTLVAKIEIIGLGPGDIALISAGALEAVKSGKKLIFRTAQHPMIKDLVDESMDIEYMDSFYESGDSFEQVYEEIAQYVVEKSKDQDIIYAVPGHPRVAETTVGLIEKKAEEKGFDVRIIPSMSFVDAMFNMIGSNPADGFILLDALSLDSRELSSAKHVVITQVYDQFVASDTKLKLMEYYEEEQGIYIVKAAGIRGLESMQEVKICELDHSDYFDDLTSIYIPMGTKQKFKNVYELEKIMEKLRSKDGCPWDIKQTHESLKKHIVEEAYEVVDAIDSGDISDWIEELGDVLLQVVFHSQIGREEGYFDIDEVADSICKKLIHRHPHVFAGEDFEEKSFMKKWEQLKKEEKGEETVTQGLRRIPRHLPALMKAQKVQKKASYVGFDWDEVDEVYKKVEEEYKEVVDAHAIGDIQYIQEELGDLLFAVVNLSRFLNVDSEEALNKTTEKFIRRFEFVENGVTEAGKKLEEMTLDQLDELWEQSKSKGL